MKKVFKLDGLECAHCAAKMETNINKLADVKSAVINFMMATLTVEADDDVFDTVVKECGKIIKKVEPDCSIIK